MIGILEKVRLTFGERSAPIAFMIGGSGSAKNGFL
jgi:hypothetical protein